MSNTKNISYRSFRVFLFALISASALRSWSQDVILTGQIRNAFTRQAIPDVTVTLMRADSTIIQDSLMSMVFDGYTIWVKRGMPRVPQKLIVKVTHPEFETAYLSYQLKNFGRNRQIDLPVILMERKVMKELTLNDVVIRPTLIKMVQRGDTIVYDATAFNLPQGSMLDDLVRELPGAELKPNGEIFVNGKKVDYLMLNSREFFRGNNQVMLRNLPYYTVKDIKVYNRTTDLSVYLGREAENKEYVMDVQLKKVYRQGCFGNVEAGYGSHNSYKGRAFVLQFTDKSRFTWYGGMNNINDVNRPLGDGQWGSALDTDGEKKQNMTGGELFWESQDRTFRNTLKALAERTETDTESRTAAQTFIADGSTSFSRLQNISIAKQTDVRVLDYWQVTKKWWVSGDILFDHSRRDSNASSDYASSLTDIMLSDTLSSRSSCHYREGHNSELVLHVGATRKLAWGDEVAFEAKYKHVSAEHKLYGKNITSQNVQPPLIDYRHEYDKAEQTENYCSLKTKYTIPFLSGPTVSLAYNSIHRRQTDQDRVFRLDLLKDWSNSANQPLCLLPSMTDMVASCIDLDNTYNYKDVTTSHVLTLNISHRTSTQNGTKRNIEFDFPMNLIHERMEYTRGRIDTIGARNYVILNPELKYESMWRDGRHIFRTSTSYLTSAPQFLQILPFRDDRNPLQVRESNPNLKQSWVYRAEASLSMRLQQSSQMLSFHVSSNIYGNQIANGFTFNPVTGVYTYRLENVSGNWDMKGEANYSMSFGKDQCFKLENRTSASFLHSVDMASLENSTQSTHSKVNTTVVNDKASLAFSRKEFRVESFGGLALRHTVSVLDLFESIDVVDFNYGVKVRYTVPALKFTAQTDITMYSRRGYGDSEFNTNDLIWNVTMSRPFMNGRIVVYADVMDVLRNRRSTQYSVNAQGRTVTWQRSMPSYAMLRVQWRFNYNPKKR